MLNCYLFSKFVDLMARANVNRVSKGLTSAGLNAPEKLKKLSLKTSPFFHIGCPLGSISPTLLPKVLCL